MPNSNLLKPNGLFCQIARPSSVLVWSGTVWQQIFCQMLDLSKKKFLFLICQNYMTVLTIVFAYELKTDIWKNYFEGLLLGSSFGICDDLLIFINRDPFIASQLKKVFNGLLFLCWSFLKLPSEVPTKLSLLNCCCWWWTSPRLTRWGLIWCWLWK